MRQLELFPCDSSSGSDNSGPVQRDGTGVSRTDFLADLGSFEDLGAKTRTEVKGDIVVFRNEFWTARQRASHSLHEISYRACFKAALPAFFIERLTSPGDVVYDPFMGRGTTPLEACLWGRVPYGCDLNPIGKILVEPRLSPPTVAAVAARLEQIDLESWNEPLPDDLLVFFHPTTLGAIMALRHYLLTRETEGRLDDVDSWIRMVALNRLTGHSPGFFSVYTLPPNQATSVTAQRRINLKRNQSPPVRDVRSIILKKTRSLLVDGNVPCRRPKDALILVGSADQTPEIPNDSVNLVVTSPPFLNIVDYAGDNWMRGWFCGIDTSALNLAVTASIPKWRAFITDVFRELKRVVRPSGWIAFEVGEVRKGAVLLEDEVILAAGAAGLQPRAIVINEQTFSKTANCWGVDNNAKGTNTNRIVLIQV